MGRDKLEWGQAWCGDAGEGCWFLRHLKNVKKQFPLFPLPARRCQWDIVNSNGDRLRVEMVVKAASLLGERVTAVFWMDITEASLVRKHAEYGCSGAVFPIGKENC